MKKKVLLIDDFRVSNEILSNFISDEDCEIITIQNPEAAFGILSSQFIDLIITDYQMPKLNGIELMLKIRQLKGYEKIPVIILSSIKKAEIKQMAVKNNVTAWIDKPISTENANKIKTFIKNLF